MRGQWSDAAGKIGLHLDPALTNEQAVEASDYHGAVVTYQQVCLAPTIFQRACKSKKTLLILDELHHAGDGKNWESEDQKRKPCPFLITEGNKKACRIYPVRPEECRAFPVDTDFGTCGVACPAAEEVYLKLKPMCRE